MGACREGRGGGGCRSASSGRATVPPEAQRFPSTAHTTAALRQTGTDSSGRTGRRHSAALAIRAIFELRWALFCQWDHSRGALLHLLFVEEEEVAEGWWRTAAVEAETRRGGHVPETVEVRKESSGGTRGSRRTHGLLGELVRSLKIKGAKER